MSENFIHYNKLNFEESRLFFALQLNQYLAKAKKVLFKDHAFNGFIKFEDLNFDQKTLDFLNLRIVDMLALIGRNSNFRFTKPKMNKLQMARAQDKFFLKPYERESFARHLLVSMTFEKMNRLKKHSKNIPTIENSLLSNINSVLGELKGGKRFLYGDFKMSAMEVRAVGAYYLINLIWKTAQESLGQDQSNSNLESKIVSLLQSSYGLFSLLNALDEHLSRSIGGNESVSDVKSLHDVIDEVAVNNLDKTTKEVIFLARKKCASLGIPFYKSDTTAAKRIRKLM